MSTEAASQTQPRILLVDDDPDHLALYERWLTLAGYRVDTAGGGSEALASLERARPDLVLSDLVMDDMDGLRLLSEIHRQDPVLPTMVMSGKAGVADALKAAHLGVSGFLEKPFDKDTLLTAVGESIGKPAPTGTQAGTLETAAGKSVTEALRALAERTGVSEVGSLVAMLVQTERFGTSLTETLRVHAEALRVQRFQRAEEVAGKAPLKMLFPTVLIFLATLIVTVGPGVLQFLTFFAEVSSE